MIVFLLSLTACGWHLRGTAVLPPGMAHTYLDIPDKTGPIARHLQRALRAANIDVLSEPDKNAAVLTVQPSSGRRVLSVGPDGRALEYELFATAAFSVHTADGSFELEQQEVTLNRDVLFDPLVVLAGAEEQQQLQNDMEKQLAGLIIDRISATYVSDLNTAASVP